MIQNPVVIKNGRYLRTGARGPGRLDEADAGGRRATLIVAPGVAEREGGRDAFSMTGNNRRAPSTVRGIA
ncbi:hypothetical protein FHR81_000483 [Actinoalloteichus hoggarensis]|nr:hypothetical protein [Actinoalloteichus hoggarensis]MBB5919454.1 hypothetical protein [Actinoalloteichus hoggarensis]